MRAPGAGEWGYLWAMRTRFLGLLALPLLASCTKPLPPPPPAPVLPVVDPWVVGTDDVAAKEPALLWNGLLGFRFGRDGSPSGQPMFAIDEYDPTGEEKLRRLTNPLNVVWKTSSGLVLDPAKGVEYRQRLDMRSSELVTRWKQDLGGEVVPITVSVYLHPTQRQLAMRWTVGGKSTLTAALPSVPLEVTPSGMKVALKPAGALQISGEARSAEVTVSFGRSPNWIAMMSARGVQVRMRAGWDAPASPLTYEQIKQAALDTWRKRWLTDIEVDGPVEDQQAIRSFLFYLRSAVHPEGGMSVSPFGLSHEMYNGHVFWDSDIWVFPALALIDLKAARAISDYRLQPNKSAPYPWESSVSGREVAPAMRDEIHISGSVAWSLQMAAALGLVDPTQAKTVLKSAADFYVKRSVVGPGGQRELKGVVSPDENHTGDNDLYTNLLAQFCVNGGKWTAGAVKFKLPQDDKSFLTYDDDALRSYKQAAAVLSIYPLQYPPAEKQAKAMMARFAEKVTQNGPAMSDSVHATIWARLGESEPAYTAWRAAWEPFTRHPFMLFSEKRKKQDTYFTTGSGGALQTVLFGFLGFRVDWNKEPDAKWSIRAGDQWLSIRPNLPPQWKSVTLRNFNVRGQRLTVTATPKSVRVVPGG